MKKSTLITTIAMIVVVVVALSTATYAWFTSAATINVTGSFTTQAGSDWTITVGDNSAGTVSLTGAAKTSDTFADQAGLLSPTATLAGTLTAASTTSAIVGTNIMYTADQNGANAAKLHGAGTEAYPVKVYKVTNTTGSAQNLVLKIYVYGNASTSTAPLFAMAAYSFSVDFRKVNSTPDASTTTVTNGYNIGATASNPAAIASYADKADVTKGTAVDASVSGLTGTKPTYATAGAGTGFSTATASTGTTTNTSIAEGDKYIEYTITIGSIESKYCADVAIYSWIDGWEADEGAAAAAFNVVYSFQTATPAP